MTNRANQSQDNVSSRTGRQWIDQQLGSDTNTATPNVQVIPIPDLRSFAGAAQPVEQMIADVEASNFQGPAESLDVEAPIAAATVLSMEKLGVTNEMANVAMPPVSLAMPAAAPAVSAAAVEEAEPIKRGYLSTLDRNSDEVDGVCRQIVEKFPGDAPSAIMFCSSEANQKAEYTAAQTAVSITEKIDGQILLIDSDFENGNLSLWQHEEKASGACDLFCRQIDLEDVICQTSEPRIDFLPVGNISGFNMAKSMQKLSKTIATLKSKYRLIVVNAGDAHSKAAGIWSQHTSGCYLMVSMENTSKAVAKSAVSHLESCGARVMGCIVSEVSQPTVGF